MLPTFLVISLLFVMGNYSLWVWSGISLFCQFSSSARDGRSTYLLLMENDTIHLNTDVDSSSAAFQTPSGDIYHHVLFILLICRDDGLARRTCLIGHVASPHVVLNDMGHLNILHAAALCWANLNAISRPPPPPPNALATTHTHHYLGTMVIPPTARRTRAARIPTPFRSTIDMVVFYAPPAVVDNVPDVVWVDSLTCRVPLLMVGLVNSANMFVGGRVRNSRSHYQ